jgi:hypothetical protein
MPLVLLIFTPLNEFDIHNFKLQKTCQCYLMGYSKVYKTLYVLLRTIYVRIRTAINIKNTLKSR